MNVIIVTRLVCADICKCRPCPKTRLTLLSPRPARVRDREIGKTDEPTCDQLKAMCEVLKKQARASEIMNEVNSYRNPLMYNEWPVYTAIPKAAPRY
ncbi:unnamed protein product [Parnassius apollo]|uniref:(apollo) hypothetical protein n=1 Tax=Parnassius apollo TaxID=110799 RepID=A0A8S3XS44_PARAO|nr:unnamed protein product [Parnassius apollo]